MFSRNITCPTDFARTLRGAIPGFAIPRKRAAPIGAFPRRCSFPSPRTRMREAPVVHRSPADERSPAPVDHLSRLRGNWSFSQACHPRAPKSLYRSTAARARSVKRETASAERETRCSERETRSVERETRSAGCETAYAERETPSAGTGSRSSGRETRPPGRETRSPERETRSAGRRSRSAGRDSRGAASLLSASRSPVVAVNPTAIGHCIGIESVTLSCPRNTTIGTFSPF